LLIAKFLNVLEERLLRERVLSLTSVLFEFYTFSEFIRAVYNTLGLGNLTLLGLSYFAILVYFSRMPRLSPLSMEPGKLYVISFIQETIFMISALVLVLHFQHMGLRLGFVVLAHFSLIYIVIYLALEVLLKNIKDLYYYESYLYLRMTPSLPLLLEVLPYIRSFWKKMRESMQAQWGSPDATKIPPPLAKMWRSRTIFWTMMLTLGYYFIVFNPSFPLIYWIFIVYFLAAGGVIGTAYYALIIHVRTTPYLIIKTSTGEEHKGFLITRDEDLYILKTREGDELLPSRLVVEVVPSEPPENPRGKII